MSLDLYIRLASIHARAVARQATDFVAQGVFDFEGDEVETCERTLGCRHIDPDSASRIEPIDPRQGESSAINIVLVSVAVTCYLPQNPAGDSAFEISSIAE